jgi:hypothetical protein
MSSTKSMRSMESRKVADYESIKSMKSTPKRKKMKNIITFPSHFSSPVSPWKKALSEAVMLGERGSNGSAPALHHHKRDLIPTRGVRP